MDKKLCHSNGKACLTLSTLSYVDVKSHPDFGGPETMKRIFMILLNFFFKKDPESIIKQNYKDRVMDRYRPKK